MVQVYLTASTRPALGAMRAQLTLALLHFTNFPALPLCTTTHSSICPPLRFSAFWKSPLEYALHHLCDGEPFRSR